MATESFEETKFILKSLVLSSAFGMTINRLNDDYRKTIGCQIPYRKFGFSTIIQFLSSMNDTLVINDKYSRNPMIYVASSEKTYHIENNSSIRKNVKYNTHVSIPNNNKYVTTVSRPQINLSAQLNSVPNNRNVIKDEVNVNKYLDKIEEPSNKKVQINKIEEPSKKIEEPSNKIEEPSKKINEIEKKTYCEEHEDEAVPDLTGYDIFFLMNFPKDTVKFGHKINLLEYPENLTVGDKLLIFVSEVHNPFKFWFQIAKQKVIDDLMEELENFYGNLNEKEYLMDFSNIMCGQICASLYEGVWHRAEILGKPHNNEVKVLFFDYGTVEYVPLNTIKYLPIHFANLRRQALRGSLSHILPVGTKWSRDATYAFLDLVIDKPLYGKVTQILHDEKIIRFVLIDTAQDNDLNINNALILKGHAELIDNSTSLDKFIYPTFDMLENGEYPSFGEIGKLLSQGIDYEANVHNNIVCDAFARKCTLKEYINILTTYHVKRIN